jgi:hypothetical protein
MVEPQLAKSEDERSEERGTALSFTRALRPGGASASEWIRPELKLPAIAVASNAALHHTRAPNNHDCGDHRVHSAPPRNHCGPQDGGQQRKPTPLYLASIRYKPHRPTTPACAPHDIRLYITTHTTTAAGASCWSYSWCPKWSRGHYGSGIPGQAELKCGWRRHTR